MTDAAQWFRPEVLSLPAYVPGGVASDPEVVKVASNENPFPPLKQVQAAIASVSGSANRYPDMAARRLVADIAAFHGWDAAGIVVGNGSTAIIEKVLHAVVGSPSGGTGGTGDARLRADGAGGGVCGGVADARFGSAAGPRREVVYPWRSFEAYPIAVQAAGGVSVQVPLAGSGAHDLPAMAAAVGPDTAAVILCSPNNPTGVALAHAEVAGFLEQVPVSVPVLLDEAYIDFVRMDDAVRSRELLEAHPNLVVLRTFSKAYGLAGLRVGYALCSPELAGPLNAIMTPFGVNSLAQAAARAALASRVQVRRNVEWIVAERERLARGVATLGVEIPASQANFVWFATGGDSARFAELCEAQKLRVRRFGDEGVRVSVGERSGTDRLLRALGAFVA